MLVSPVHTHTHTHTHTQSNNNNSKTPVPRVPLKANMCVAVLLLIIQQGGHNIGIFTDTSTNTYGIKAHKDEGRWGGGGGILPYKATDLVAIILFSSLSYSSFVVVDVVVHYRTCTEMSTARERRERRSAHCAVHSETLQTRRVHVGQQTIYPGVKWLPPPPPPLTPPPLPHHPPTDTHT